MMEPIKAIRGTVDILPGDVEIWQTVEDTVRKWTALFGCEEIRTPIFEETRLFVRSIGDDTDIVGKEMYTFTDMGGRNVTLRPEGTASVIRAFIEHSLDQRGLPQSLWYMGPMFRQERPQKGRQRQFHQFGVEVIGSPHAGADVETISLFDRIAGELGLEDRELTVNFIGSRESRERYKEQLVLFLKGIETHLCKDCTRRIQTNPLRVLDCKVPECHEAVHESGGLPRINDFLTENDRSSYASIRAHLSTVGIPFKEDPFLVRGLDYYTGIVFEMNRPELGAQSAIMGGGRYDALVRELGGPDLPAVGFACGMERLILAMRESGQQKVASAPPKTYVVIPPDQNESATALHHVALLRRQGHIALVDYLRRSVKAQMRAASKWGARYVLFIGTDSPCVEVRDMEKSTQESMTFEAFLDLLNTKDS
jgi:histidyl-tRNA synthetase